MVIFQEQGNVGTSTIAVRPSPDPVAGPSTGVFSPLGQDHSSQSHGEKLYVNPNSREVIGMHGCVEGRRCHPQDLVKDTLRLNREGPGVSAVLIKLSRVPVTQQGSYTYPFRKCVLITN